MKVLEAIDARVEAGIGRQAMFFVGTAPRDDAGHVNVSPKGPIGGVPLMELAGGREHYRLSAEKRLRVGGPDALARRRAANNARSIDGLPALDRR